MRTRSKLVSILMSLVLAVGLCPATAFAGILTTASSSLTIQTAGTDDYPSNLKSAAKDSVVDPWRFYNRECTSFVAWRLNNDNGVAFSNYYGGAHWGNANNWGPAARSLGITVDSNPAVGSVAWWSSGAYGHVAWVQSVSGNNVTIEEYNYNNNGAYNRRVVSASSVSGFIHIKDISNDGAGPSYSDFHVGEINDSTFTVMAKTTDPSGVGSVRYAVWTDNNGQDDLVWYDGHCTDGNDYYWARIPWSDHKNERGRYTVHLYAYDSTGNLTNPGISYDFSSSGPTVSDFHVGELREGAFTVMAKITDPNGIGSVRYAIWTDNAGQDDLRWYQGNHTDNNGYYWARVNFSDHKNEKGNYTIHLYAYDVAGKLTNPGLTYYFDEKGPEISNVSVSDVSTKGYTITCKVTAATGISRVQFPTWTVANDQDDLAASWETNASVRGTLSGNTATFRVNSSAHNGETGLYRTHIYAYDTLGNRKAFTVPDVNLHDHVFQKAIKQASFDADGTIAETCTICGEINSMATISKVAEPTLSSSSLVYNGKTQRPELSVKDANGIAIDSSCYTITYSNSSSMDAGSYTATVNLSGNYSGSKSVTYSITPASLSTAAIAVPDQKHTGAALTPAPTVKVGSTTLKAGTDYSVRYKDNINVGTATVTVTGKGNYAGTKQATFKIVAPQQNGSASPDSQADLSAASVTGVKSKTYAGKALTQSPTVKVGGETLKAGTDYTLSYSNNVKAGTAIMTVKGKGSYTGTKRVTFTIAKASVKSATAAKVKAKKYTGKAIKPSPKLTYKGATLKKGADYTLSYKDNKKRGTATITVKGKGNFKGTKTVKFKIK